MATIRFYLSKKKEKSFLIMAMISHGSIEKPKSVGFSINDPDKQWNKKAAVAKNHPEANNINAKLSKWKYTFEQYRGRVVRNEIDFNFEEIISMLVSPDSLAAPQKTKSVSLVNIAQEFYEMQEAMNDRGTSKQYGTMVENLKAYEEYTGRKYSLLDVDKDFYMDYGSWLIAKQDNQNNTVNKKITRIITMMNWAFGKKLLPTQYYLIRYNFKGNDSDAYPPLSPSEIETLSKANTNTKAQRVILDAFLFCCETGLRISDVQQIRAKHIVEHKDPDGYFTYLDFTQEKTTGGNTVPLNNRATEILHRQGKAGFIFELPEEQYANRFLKTAAKQEGIELDRQIEVVYNKGNKTIREFKKLHDLISFHCGRASYITNALASGINPIFVQENAGHSDLKTTMIYSTQDRVNRMKETLALQNKK